MPTYDYRCRDCDHEFEVFSRKSTRPRARKCPECGGRAERQISGGAGFLFKGEGFYITDYRSKEYQSKAKAEREGSSDKKKSKDKPKDKSSGGSAGGS